MLKKVTTRNQSMTNLWLLIWVNHQKDKEATVAQMAAPMRMGVVVAVRERCFDSERSLLLLIWVNLRDRPRKSFNQKILRFQLLQ